MKRYLEVCLTILLIILSSCQPTPQYEVTTVASTQVIEKGDKSPIEFYQDVRDQNYRGLDFDLDQSVIETLWFNESTSWPKQYEKLAQSGSGYQEIT